MRRRCVTLVVCAAEEWRREVLPEILARLEAGPTPSPLVYLQVGNITLHGAPGAYKALFRRKPKSYELMTFTNLYPGAHSDQPVVAGGGGAGGSGSGGANAPGSIKVVAHVGTKSTRQNESRENLWTVSSVLLVFMLLSLAFSNSMRKELLGPMERIIKILEV